VKSELGGIHSRREVADAVKADRGVSEYRKNLARSTVLCVNEKFEPSAGAENVV